MAVVKCCRHHLDVFAKLCMFASDTSSTNNAPLLQMKRLIWQQKVENKTWHDMQNQNVVQHNTNTTLQMWELWRSACCESIILAVMPMQPQCFTFPGKAKVATHFFVSVCSPSGLMGEAGRGLKLSCRLLQLTIRRQHLFRAPGTDERKL